MKKLSVLLALCLVISLLPCGALAAGEDAATAEPLTDDAAVIAEEPAADGEADAPGADGDPPAKPEDGGTPPAKPEDGGTPPAKPDDNGGSGEPGGPGSASVTYAGATTITGADSRTGETYATSTVDESALIIDTNEAVSVTDPTVTKSGSSNGGDSCNFYGLNAAVLAMGGTTATITGGTIYSDASGANGVFSYGGNGGSNGKAGDGTTVVIRDTEITTTGSGSGGIMTTGGGVTYAYDLTVTTSGGSSAPIRTDRGGGTVVVDGGTYTSNGLGSPAIYSTADVTVKNASLISNLSEGVCIEGKNSITLENCDLTANNTRMNGNATFLDTIMIYQSMSGDADSGTSSFTMTGGTLTSKSGHIFHVTNTSAVIRLTDVELVNEDSDSVLLSVCSDGWSGASNIAALYADRQTLDGAVLVGSDSQLTMDLKNHSVFTGSVGGSITNAKGGTVSTSVGTVSVTLDSSSIWILTADSRISSFSGDPGQVYLNGHTLYVSGTPLSGASSGRPRPADAAALPGDVNGDGSVTRQDRICLSRYLAGWDGYDDIDLAAGDVNRDGTVDRKDRIYLARTLAGWADYALN